MAVQNTYYKPPTTNSNTCIFTSCPVGDVPTSLLSHCYSPTGAVSVPLCLCYLVPSRGPGWYVVPLPGELWVTLNFPLNDIDFSLLFSHLYKLNLVTIQHSTPMKTNHLQRYSATWVNLTTSALSKKSQAHKSVDFPVWVHVYKEQRQAKLIDAVRNQISGNSGIGHKVLGARYIDVSEKFIMWYPHDICIFLDCATKTF